MARHINRPLDYLGSDPNDSDINLVGGDRPGAPNDSGSPGETDRVAAEKLASEQRLNSILGESAAAPDAADLAEGLLQTAVKNFGSPTDPLRKSHPTLAAFLFNKSWNGVEPRETAVITISVRPTGLTATLKLPSEAQSVSIHVQESNLIFDALETALRNRSGDWKELKSGPGATKLREDRKKERDIRKKRK